MDRKATKPKQRKIKLAQSAGLKQHAVRGSDSILI